MNQHILRTISQSISTLAVAMLPAVAADVNPRSSAAEQRPNIVIILADDLGYGDVQCYNAEHGIIPTPNIDRLATQGMRFTDGHSSASSCTPSRYTLLTGRYHWRTPLQGVLLRYDPPLIDPERLTVAGLLQHSGYHTAVMGKWHLGMRWNSRVQKEKAMFYGPQPDSALESDLEYARSVWQEAFSASIAEGPTTRGFDYYFGVDLPNFPPYCFIENDHTLGIPSRWRRMNCNWGTPGFLMREDSINYSGPEVVGWKLDAILQTLGDRACAFIERSASNIEPYFLYLALTSPHHPLAVTPEWKGKSILESTYADFVMETDAILGRVLQAIEKSGAADNTLLVFTSDNGCADYIGAADLRNRGHYVNGPLRGYKGSVWEGGHRVPFIVSWPRVVNAGSICHQLVQQADLMATFADIVGARLPDTAGEDSFSLLPLLTGGNQPVRQTAVNQSGWGLFAIRKGSWKLVFGPGSTGNDNQRGPGQLYNLAKDIAEEKNLYDEKPELVAELTALMERIVNEGRSTPGIPQRNDVPVNWKRFMKTKLFRSSEAQ